MDIIAPLFKLGFWGIEFNLIIGFLIGFFFGTALEKAGFGNARKLTAQFYLQDMTVFKVMFSAVVTALVLLTITGEIGLLDYDLLFINQTHIWSQIVGGTMLGIGFNMGGYCPGTSIVAVSSGKIDGMVYVLGFFFGLFIFPNIFDSIHDLYEAGHMGTIILTDILPIPRTTLVTLIVIAAMASFYGATKVEQWAKKKWNYEKI